MKSVFLGPPGVGKGTQAERLCADRGLPHISTGDILREARRNKTPVGIEAESYMNAGRLVPDGVILKLVSDRLSKGDVAGGFVFDGFPRTVAQAEALEQTLKERRWALDHVIYFEATEEVIVRRISGRRVCEKCASTFHVEYSPPQHPNTCDHCGGPLAQRPDDAEASVRERLRVYESTTTPLIGFYANRGVLRRVSADGDPDQVFEEMLAELE
ncbi:MAG: adenylate kinase [Candidatus Handelsmanbacteria bacterium RIFCSPLOWO2_12_FULL_64_10]|uniref:Adenylate kinase n=1 Tax=Handelsmanbacteria sp. (strain RIFCSPLOWO2_12_FULL_64_10) TaxID=1817868 RepID=A0A1F6CA74_HANXR|nr:MAG: adenylate kinase [Candidatus Handelsmanbacteria bacterium RIFCSPLOWO2_12_FULL_64_10]